MLRSKRLQRRTFKIILFLLGVFIGSISAASILEAECQRRGKNNFKLARISLLFAADDRPVPGYRRLKRSKVLDLARYPDQHFKLKARVSRQHRCQVRSVEYRIRRPENITLKSSRPFLLEGLSKTSNDGWRPEVGTYLIRVVSKSKANGRGRRGRVYRLKFKVIDSSTRSPGNPGGGSGKDNDAEWSDDGESYRPGKDSNGPFKIIGPTHVTAGYPWYVEFLAPEYNGPRNNVYLQIEGLPAHTSYSVPTWQEVCCGDFGWDLRDTLIRIETTAETPVGLYPVKFTVRSGSNSWSKVKYLLVERPKNIVRTDLELNPPPIPYLSNWEDNMTKFGRKWCEDESQNTLWEGNVWYYDGTRVFQQIADYTGNSYWNNECARKTRNIYSDFVAYAEPGVQGWRVFPHGLYQHYIETGNNRSKRLLLELSNSSAWSYAGGAVNPEFSRETAYLLHAFLYRLKLGEGEHERFERTLSFALGHLDQIARAQTEEKIKPFMLGLTFEALIHYYEYSGDSRIPRAIKQAAEWLWFESGLWDSSSQSFLYVNKNFPGDDPPDPAPDLNLLIAPAYAWLYSISGESVYQEIADEIFAGGVNRDLDNDGYYDHGSCLACTGKIFSQNYRWTFDFVRWRSGL